MNAREWEVHQKNQEKKYRAIVDSKPAVQNLGNSEELEKKMREKLKEELATDEGFLYEAQLDLLQVKKGIEYKQHEVDYHHWDDSEYKDDSEQ